MREVSRLTPDALLYLVALLDHYKQKEMRYDINGDIPMEPVSRRLFIQSGFLDYVTSNLVDKPKRSKRVLSIEKHSLVEGPLAKNIMQFCLEHFGQKGDKKSKGMYRAIIELMNNTRDHAYPPGEKAKLRWYTMAVYDERSAKITVSFLDAGVGIPTTIRKNFGEKVREMMAVIPGIDQVKHHVLIRSALEGDLRTRTGTGYRGKGLPTVYKCFQDGSINNMIILSNHAFLNLSTGEEYDLARGLRGSLFTWTISQTLSE